MSKKTRNFYRLFRRPLEWLAIGLGEMLIPPLSLKGTQRLAQVIADAGYLFDRRGRAITHANLALMFGNRLTPAREAIIARHAYRNMARVLVNVFWLSRHTQSRIMDQAIFSPDVLRTVNELHPAITVSAHLGNWEILSQACVANGIPMMSVAKDIGSSKITARLMALRSTIGQQIVPAEGALRSLIGALRNNVSIGLLIDQHTHLWAGGGWVSLFGVPAGISLTPAALARKLSRPIIFAWSRPLKDGRYRIEPGNVFLPSPELDDTALTQKIADAFEHVIRRHPSLWCLNYRRWRYIRPGDAPDRYPSYARPARLAPAPPRNQK